MYYVIGTHNSSLENFPQVICTVKEDPTTALLTARRISEKKDNDNVRKVFIIQIEKNEELDITDYLPGSSSKTNPVVFVKWQKPGTVEWLEKFEGSFKMYNRRGFRAHDKKEEIATKGKFRAIVMIDSDEMQQIDEDTTTREEAYQLCVAVAQESFYPFCVFDDKGVPQTKNGQLIQLATT